MATQTAVNPVPPSGIVLGNDGLHPLNVYHDNSGSAGLLTVAQYLAVIVLTCVHVDVLNVMS